MAYFVVGFTEKDEIETVPSTWFDNESDMCVFPPSNGSSLARKRAPPASNWPVYKASCLFSTSEYIYKYEIDLKQL